MNGWQTCDAMLSLTDRQREALLDLIGTPNDSNRIAVKVGCAVDIVKMIRAERMRRRKTTQRRDNYRLELARREARRATEGVADWPKPDGRRLDEVLIAMNHPLPVNCAAPLGVPVMITGRLSGPRYGGGVLGPWS